MRYITISLLILVLFNGVAIAQKKMSFSDSVVHFDMTEFGFGYDASYLKSRWNEVRKLFINSNESLSFSDSTLVLYKLTEANVLEQIFVLDFFYGKFDHFYYDALNNLFTNDSSFIETEVVGDLTPLFKVDCNIYNSQSVIHDERNFIIFLEVHSTRGHNVYYIFPNHLRHSSYREQSKCINKEFNENILLNLLLEAN